MLYGRIGYIFALLFVNKNFGEEKIPQSHIQQVIQLCGVSSIVGSCLHTLCLYLVRPMEEEHVCASVGEAQSESQQLPTRSVGSLSGAKGARRPSCSI